MTISTGTVTAITPETVTVTTDSQVGCRACDTGAGCGLGPVLALFVRNPRRTVQLRSPAKMLLRVGDRVRFVTHGNRVALLALMAYGLPLVGILAGAGVAFAVAPGGGDGATIAGATVGAALAWALLRLLGPGGPETELLQAEITLAP